MKKLSVYVICCRGQPMPRAAQGQTREAYSFFPMCMMAVASPPWPSGCIWMLASAGILLFMI